MNRATTVQIRVREEEKERMRLAAKRAGMWLSEWAREVLLGRIPLDYEVRESAE